MTDSRGDINTWRARFVHNRVAERREDERRYLPDQHPNAGQVTHSVEDTTMTGTQLRQVLNGVKGRAGATLSTATREKIDGAMSSLQSGVVSIEEATTLLTELLESATPASDSEEARYLPAQDVRMPAADDKGYLPL